MRITPNPRTHTKALEVASQRSSKAMKLFEDLEREFTLAGAEASDVVQSATQQIEALATVRAAAIAEVKLNEKRAKSVRELFA